MPIQRKTPEERKKALAELEALDPNAAPTEPTETPEPEVTPAPEVTPESEATPELDPETGEPIVEGEEEPEVVPPVKTPEQIEAEKKAAASAAEAQILITRQKKEREIREKAKTLPAPDETALRNEYPEWDDMTPIEQRLATQNLHNQKKLELIESIDEEVKADENFITQVSAYAVDPATTTKFPKIEGHEEDFLQFASKPTRRGLDLEDVMIIFLSSLPQRPLAPRGSLMERGASSQNKTPRVSTNLDTEQMAKLRQVDQKRWAKAAIAAAKAKRATHKR